MAKNDKTLFVIALIALLLYPAAVLARSVALPDTMINRALPSDGVPGNKNAKESSAVSFSRSLEFLVIEPLVVDLGTIGKGESCGEEITFTNKADKMLRWYLDFRPPESSQKSVQHLRSAYYISLRNKNGSATMASASDGRIRKEMFVFQGNWGITGDYPQNLESGAFLEFSFNGTGVLLSLVAAGRETKLEYILDGKEKKRVVASGVKEAEIVKGASYGEHRIQIIFLSPQTVLRGIKIFGAPVEPAPKDSVSIVPMSSRIIARETEKARIGVTTKGLKEGLYNHFLFLNAEETIVPVEIYFEVKEKEQNNGIRVHRYKKGSEYVLTSLSSEDAEHLTSLGYHDDGVALNLFPRGTPGTLPLSRFVLPSFGERYYFVESQKHPVPHGYVRECDIGNIATSRLSDTKPLFRLRAAKGLKYIFTTSTDEKGMRKRGFVFEEIVGYVK